MTYKTPDKVLKTSWFISATKGVFTTAMWKRCNGGDEVSSSDEPTEKRILQYIHRLMAAMQVVGFSASLTDTEPMEWELNQCSPWSLSDPL